jgi:hypothetical protein
MLLSFCFQRALVRTGLGVGGPQQGFVSMSVWRTAWESLSRPFAAENLVAGRGFEPPDLQVMSLASYRCSTPLLTAYRSVISYVFGFFEGENAKLETGFRKPPFVTKGGAIGPSGKIGYSSPARSCKRQPVFPLCFAGGNS